MTNYMKEAERLLDEFYLHVSAMVASALADEWAEVQAAQSLAVQARAALLAHIQRGAVPEGWQLVPIDPSPGMLDAAEAVDWGDEDTRGSCCNQWHAMLAAAPAPDHFRDAAKMMATTAEVPNADQLWNNDEVMALNAELGLTLDQMLRLVRAALRGEVKP